MFIALELPAGARAALTAWRDEAIANREDLRPVAAEALHLTLCFLGWRPEKQAGAIAERAFSACADLAAVRLAARALEPVPPQRPRLFALDLADEAGQAAKLQGRIATALAAARMYEPERRPFWPHVTLTRVKRGVRAAPLAPASPPPPEPFCADEVTLYRSTLRPQGALYEPLARTRLGQG